MKVFIIIGILICYCYLFYILGKIFSRSNTGFGGYNDYETAKAIMEANAKEGKDIHGNKIK